MAKFNITIDSVDFDFSEGADLDGLIKQEIISRIVGNFSTKFTKEITQEAQAKISEIINNTIDLQVNQITEGLLNKRFDLCDRYGDVKKKDTSVMDLLKERLDTFLEDKVDRSGRTGGYDSQIKRIDYLVQQNIEKPMQDKIDQTVKNIRVSLEKHMETTIKTQIGEQIAKSIGLDKIVKQ